MTLPQLSPRLEALRMKMQASRGRLIFALDATMSRQPTWDQACHLQADMFGEAAALGGIDIQPLYYRGLAECRASRFVSDAAVLRALMEKIDCRSGHTQIGRVLDHAQREAKNKQVQALTFVGDAMEEAIDDLCASASELGLLRVPAFMFQEGDDPAAEHAFREIARVSGGAYSRFDAGAAGKLGELLRAVVAFALGGIPALEGKRSDGARLLLSQLKNGG